MKMTSVSVIMPSFNSGEYIESALTSVHLQSFKDWELIVVDNGSTDNTVTLVELFVKRDKRIKLIKNTSNLYASGARNIGMDYCSGKYITFLDSDDLWDSDFLEEMYRFSSENNFLFTYASYRIFDEVSGSLKSDYLVPSSVCYEDLLRENSISCLTAFVNKEIIGVLKMQGKVNEDYLFWLQLLKRIRYAHGFSRPIATYNLRKGSASRNKLKIALMRWRIYRHHEKIYFFKALFYFVIYVYNGVSKYYLR